MAILCSVLAWMTRRDGAARVGAKRRKMSCRKVYYATRTHGQAKQVMKELNKTRYVTDLGVSAVILGGREHLCAYDLVRAQQRRDWTCRQLVVIACESAASGLHTPLSTENDYSAGCVYYNEGKLDAAQQQVKQSGRCMDIEDLYELCRRREACPYYTSKELARDPQVLVVILPTCEWSACV